MHFVLSVSANAGTVIDSMLTMKQIFINEDGSFLVRLGRNEP